MTTVTPGLAHATTGTSTAAPAHAPSTASAVQETSITTNPTSPTNPRNPARPASTTNTATTDQPRRPASPTGLANRTRTPIAAVTPQQPTVSTSLPSASRPVHAVADQWTPQQRLCRRIDQTQQTLLHRLRRRHRRRAGGLGAGIGLHGTGQGLHEPRLKRAHLRADRLILLRVRAKQCRNGRRHLIGPGRKHRGGRTRRGGISRANRRP